MRGTHPPDGALRDFALGRLGDPDDAAVEAHLSECPDCLARATDPGPPDTLVELLAAAAARPDPTPAPDDGQTLTLAAGATPSQALTRGFSGAGLGATPDGSDAPPAVLVGHPRYRPVRFLGVGGMGSVWLAEHAVMGRQVAVKVIRPELLTRPLAAERFVREVRAAARLHHPNIVAAFDAEEAAGACLLVMEFVPGEPLSEVVRGGPLPVAEACRVARDAARGLAHAHAAGLVHRDVKPSNLIRTPDGATKVLDFGLVTDDDRPAGLTGENIVMGTPDYIAPEQADDAHTADARADVYGLGCTLYHLLAGRVPFPGGSVLKKLDAHRTATADPLTGVPPALAAVVARMMARRPEDRFPNAAEVAEALEPFARGEVPELPPRPRRRVLAAVAAGVLAVVGLTVAAVAYEVRRGNEVVTIETDDPVVEVVMRRNGELIRIVDTKTNQTWELDTQKMRLTPDGKELSIDLPGRDPLTIRRADGGKVAVVVRRPAVEPTGEVRVFRGHTDGLLTVAVSPDGKYAATAGSWPVNDDPVIRLWEIASGKEVRQFEGHEHCVYQVAFSPDGKRLLSVSQDGSGRVWDVDTGRGLTRLTTENGVGYGGVFTPDGKAAVTCCGRVNYWDLDAGAEQKRFDPITAHQMRCLDLSPDGKTVAVGEWVTEPGPGQLRLWDVATGKARGTLIGHTNLVYAVRYSPDGKRLASASADGTARVWDVTASKELHLLKHTHWVSAVAFSPDGRYLATGGDDRLVHIWDTTTSHEVHRFVGHEQSVWSLAFTPDGRYVLSASADKTLRMWRLPAALVDPPAAAPGPAGAVRSFRLPQGVGQAVAITPDGRHAYTGNNGGLPSYGCCWDLHTGELVRTIGRHDALIHDVALSPDGNRLLTTSFDGTARLWDVKTGRELKTYAVDGRWVLRGAFTRDGKHALVTTSKLRVIDLADGRDLKRFDDYVGGGDGNIQAMALSPDGTHVATGDHGGDVRLWELETGKLVRQFLRHDERSLVYQVAFSPDGTRLLSAGTDGTARVWDAATGKEVHRLKHPAVLHAAAFSPGGRYVSTGGVDRVVRVWDTTTGTEVHQFRGHGWTIWAVPFTPDGRHILSACQDGWMRLLRLPDTLADTLRK